VANSAPRGRRPVRVLVVLVAVVFLFGPAVAFVGGARARAFENHALARFPSPDRGWAFFTSLSSPATDHLPVREQAVRANAQINKNVFRDSPIVESATPGAWPEVLMGKNGTWYWGDDIRLKCTTTVPEDFIASRLDDLVAAIEASGRTAIVTSAPDKSDIAGQNLPSSFRGKDCAVARSASMWALLDQRPYFIDLRASLLAAAKTTDYPLYMPHDTHWDGAGGAAFVTSIVARIAPDVVATFTPRLVRSLRLPSDLGIVSGLGGLSTRHEVLLEEPGITHDYPPLADPGAIPQNFRSIGPAGSLVTAPTVMFGDSFLLASQPDLAGVFANLTTMSVQTPGLDLATAVAQVKAAKVVVIESVERDLFTGNAAILLPAFADAIRALPPA
jgi:alginate O-acetyltransferase complex protein AlgJ